MLLGAGSYTIQKTGALEILGEFADLNAAKQFSTGQAIAASCVVIHSPGARTDAGSEVVYRTPLHTACWYCSPPTVTFAGLSHSPSESSSHLYPGRRCGVRKSVIASGSRVVVLLCHVSVA